MPTDLDLSEEEFKSHWMINPVPEEGGIDDGKNDSRTAVDYADYTALRAKGCETVSDENDSHTDQPDPEDDPAPPAPDPEPDPEQIIHRTCAILLNYMSNNELIVKGATGMTGSFIAVIAPYQEYIQWVIQLHGGLLGITVAIITLWNLTRKNKKK